jgi:hypothetical protein
MRSRSRVGCVVSLLVATGCSASASDKGQSGSAQGAGSSAGASGAESGAVQTGSGASANLGDLSGSAASGGGVTSGGATGNPGGASGSLGESAGTTGAGSGGATAGDAASGQASGASEGGAPVAGNEGGTSAGPFTCNMVLGLFTTSQWFSGMSPGGATTTFLMDGVDATRWEGKMTKYAYIEKWIDPTNAVWSLTTTNPCTTNSTTPDRVIFVAFSPGIAADQDYQMYSTQGKTEAGWETLLDSVIATIKTKYPSALEIDIMTMGRAPGNMLCANNNDIDTIIQPYEDAAYQAVAAASAGFVKVGPMYYVPDCANSYIFANDSDYTTSAANAIAMQVATYYLAHP